jgi:energy-converting hydrogenase Eha subunit A
MIQRIQTLYLAISSLLLLSIWFLPWMERASEDPNRFAYLAATLLTVGVVLVNAVAIFRFSVREQQIRIAQLATILLAALLATQLGVLFTLGGIGTYLIDESITPLITLFSILLNLLAVRAIRSDIQKVRSMDRIR